MKGLLSDIVSTVRFFDQQRKTRKARVLSEHIEPDVIRIPVYTLPPAFYNTVEGCMLSNCGKKADAAGCAAFKAMSYEQQRAMEWSPKQGEFVERANLWREALQQIEANSKDKHAAMVGILSWYRHIKLKHMSQN